MESGYRSYTSRLHFIPQEEDVIDFGVVPGRCEQQEGCNGFSPVCRLVKNRLCLGEVSASYTYVEMEPETYFFGRKTYTSSRNPIRAVTFV